MARLIGFVAGSLWWTLATVALLGLVAVAIGAFFGLTRTGSVGLYFVVWWTALFAILPVRIRSQAETGEVVAGTDPGAPAVPALRERAIWTSVVSTVVFAIVAAVLPLAGL